ncbi:hypothetical protein FOBRF1_014689 [Fusarium oxysporum]
MDLYTDHAVSSSKLSTLGSNIAQAVIPAGLSPENVGGVIGARTSHNHTALVHVPGITSSIIERTTIADLDTFIDGFRSVWIVGGCFVAVTSANE